jgi:hypothetical protein
MEGQMLYEDVMYCLEESGYFDCAWDDEKCRNLAAYMCSNELQKCFGYAE